jgi:predicted permease
MRTFCQRLLTLLRGKRLDRELNDEIAIHLAMQEEEFRRQGMEAAAAHAAALREFGGVTQAAEDYRERRGIPWLETAARDVRYGLRGLRRTPGFTAAAILSLALGIGANTAIFSLFHALMLRLLPVERPLELVSIRQAGGWIEGPMSYPLFQEIAKRDELFTGVIARTPVSKTRFTPRPGGRGEFTQREFVSGNYFTVLGIKPALGRLFTEDDDRTPGGHPIAVLSYDLWRNRYNADPGILGAKVLVDEQPFTVIGIAAPDFHGVEVEHRAEVWVPTMMAGMKFSDPRMWWVWVIARRRPEVAPRQVQAALNVLMTNHLNAVWPATYNPAMRKKGLEQHLEVREGSIGLSVLREEFGRPLTVMMIAVSLVLLAACANVANLLLARGAARHKEIALRLSLGATRVRLIRQALVESFLLVAAGGALGMGLAAWGQRMVVKFLPQNFGDPFGLSRDNTLLLFTLAIATLSALLFGVGPALRSTSVDPACGLRTGSAGQSARSLPRRALVVAQVAFSVVLVGLAALFGHNLFTLRSVDLGLGARNVIAFSLDLPRQQRTEVRTPMRQLAEQLQALPGVYSVSYGFPGPFLMGTSGETIRIPGSDRTARAPAHVSVARIAPRYFETIGAPLVLGRELDRNDMTSLRRVAVVNEAFVRKFLPEEKYPESRTLSFDDSRPEGGEPTYIVGVVHDIHHTGIQKAAEPTVYVPIDQGRNAGFPAMLVRTQSSPTAMLPLIYRELRRLGPSIGVADLRTLQQQIDDSIFEQRLLAALGAFFGLLALVLAAVGLYGVVAYGTARRTGEIGLRLALGAPRQRVIWMILRDSLSLVALGLALGLPAALAGARAVESVLFGIRPADPFTFAGTAALLAITGAAASFLPARRASRLDPNRLLRNE